MCKKVRSFLSTDFLTPINNFWIGFGSVINISGNHFLFNYSNSDNEADLKAIKSDWINVGRDIEKSIKKMSEKTA